MREMIILGASGFARQAAWAAQRSGLYQVIAFMDETASGSSEQGEIPIVPSLDRFLKRQPAPVLLSAVGNSGMRKRWSSRHGQLFEFATLIDPSALIADNCKLGEGCILQAGTIISNEVSVGDHSILGFNVAMSHESCVGSFTHLASGVIVNGRAKIGSGCSIGAGAIILPDVSIEDCATVGAGAVVQKNVSSGSTVVGVPAQAIGRSET